MHSHKLVITKNKNQIQIVNNLNQKNLLYEMQVLQYGFPTKY